MLGLLALSCRSYNRNSSERRAKRMPLFYEEGVLERVIVERHLCFDTTAAGGNVSLLVAES